MFHSKAASFWREIVAYVWYAWGLSLCYNGYRWTERSLYMSGVRAFERAIRAQPTFAQAYYRCGLIHGRELGQYEVAIAYLERAITLQPTWPDPYLQRGLFHRFNGHPEAAIIDLQAYIDLGGSGYWRSEAERQITLIKME